MKPMVWIRQYPWVIALMMLGFATVWALQSRSERVERRVSQMEMARHTDSVAVDLAVTTAQRDSVHLAGDSVRLEILYETISKLDSIMLILRGQQ